MELLIEQEYFWESFKHVSSVTSQHACAGSCTLTQGYLFACEYSSLHILVVQMIKYVNVSSEFKEKSVFKKYKKLF